MSRRTNAESFRAKSGDYSVASDVELAFLPHASIGRSTISLDDDKTTLLGNLPTTTKPEYNTRAWHSKQDNFQAQIANFGSGPTRRYIPLGSDSVNVNDTRLKAHGWRKSVTAAAILTGIVMVINTGFGVFATIRARPEYGVGTLYTGNCNTVKRWDTGLHSVINILSTAVLGASSFTMQCLSSPTRIDVDTAHSKRKALDIGLPSFKNLFHVKGWKACLWLLLCLSTLPLHLFWNSSIFTTGATFYLSYVVADESFLSGASYQQPNLTAGCSYPETNMISSIYNAYQAQKYTRLSAADCFKEYNVDSLSDQRNLIMITTPNSGMNMSQCYYNSQAWNGSSVIAYTPNLSPGWDNIAYWVDQFNYTAARDNATSSGAWSFGPYPVQYCYSETMFAESCRLQYVSYFIYVVVLCNVIKFTCMCIAARRLWNLSEPILATVGDATTSFLEQADETTKRLCLLDLKALRAGVWHNPEKVSKLYAYRPAYNRKPKARLYSATTGTRWWMTMILCTLYLILGFVLFGLSFELTAEGGYSDSQAMRLKFGQVDSQMLLGIGGGLVVDVLVANSFQLALSTTYFLYNSLYTAQCAALEWAAFAHGASKTLRVTFPRGQQRSTYYLHLPYRYGIPLSILLILMHFLISQSIFLARLEYYDSVGNPAEGGFSNVGYNPPAILTSCCVGLGLIMAQVFHACRSLDNRMPVHGNKSAVISALCHVEDSKRAKAFDEFPGEHETTSISSKPLAWGVTREPSGNDTSYSSSSSEHAHRLAGHCSFSDDVVELPQIGKEYR